MSLVGDIFGTSWEITPCPQLLAFPGPLPTPTRLPHRAIYPGSCGCALEVELTGEVEGTQFCSQAAEFPWEGTVITILQGHTMSCFLPELWPLPRKRPTTLSQSLHFLERICGKQSKKAFIVTKGLQKPPEHFTQSPWLPGQWLSSNFPVEMDYLKLTHYLVAFGLAWMITNDRQCGHAIESLLVAWS